MQKVESENESEYETITEVEHVSEPVAWPTSVGAVDEPHGTVSDGGWYVRIGGVVSIPCVMAVCCTWLPHRSEAVTR